MGTPEEATFSIFCRTICMTGDVPKITRTGGMELPRFPETALEIAVAIM